MTPGKGYGCTELQKVVLKSFKKCVKILENTQIFSVIVLYYTKRICSQVQSQFKVKVQDKHQAF